MLLSVIPPKDLALPLHLDPLFLTQFHPISANEGAYSKHKPKVNAPKAWKDMANKCRKHHLEVPDICVFDPATWHSQIIGQITYDCELEEIHCYLKTEEHKCYKSPLAWTIIRPSLVKVHEAFSLLVSADILHLEVTVANFNQDASIRAPGRLFPSIYSTTTSAVFALAIKQLHQTLVDAYSCSVISLLRGDEPPTYAMWIAKCEAEQCKRDADSIAASIALLLLEQPVIDPTLETWARMAIQRNDPDAEVPEAVYVADTSQRRHRSRSLNSQDTSTSQDFSDEDLYPSPTARLRQLPSSDNDVDDPSHSLYPPMSTAARQSMSRPDSKILQSFEHQIEDKINRIEKLSKLIADWERENVQQIYGLIPPAPKVYQPSPLSGCMNFEPPPELPHDRKYFPSTSKRARKAFVGGTELLKQTVAITARQVRQLKRGNLELLELLDSEIDGDERLAQFAFVPFAQLPFSPSKKRKRNSEGRLQTLQIKHSRGLRRTKSFIDLQDTKYVLQPKDNNLQLEADTGIDSTYLGPLSVSEFLRANPDNHGVCIAADRPPYELQSVEAQDIPVPMKVDEKYGSDEEQTSSDEDLAEIERFMEDSYNKDLDSYLHEPQPFTFTEFDSDDEAELGEAEASILHFS